MKDLAQVPLAMLPRAFATRRLVDDSLRAAGVVPQVRVEMESVEGLLDVCRWGDLACIAPERAARQAVICTPLNCAHPPWCGTRAFCGAGALRAAAQLVAALLKQ